jgi:CheY-like chemotaxis protein
MGFLPKNLLVIDDSLTLRKFIEKSLASETFIKQIYLAPDGGTAIDLAKKIVPDLIICDYTLPDGTGDELCRKLAEMPETAGLPIILMSSSGTEMSTLVLEGTNVVRILVKPFTRELLVATINYVLGHWMEKQIGKQQATHVNRVVLRGNCEVVSVCPTLRFIDSKKWTGILHVSINKNLTVHAFVDAGSVQVISTRQVDQYLAGTPFRTQGKKSQIWSKCEDIQRETLSPFLINLHAEGVLPEQTAQLLTALYGHRIFSHAWIEPGVEYEFEQTALPDFVQKCRAPRLPMDEWILQNLRQVETCERIRFIASDPFGVPILTPLGYTKLQNVKPQADEWDVLTRISGDRTLDDICKELTVSPEKGAQKIFRFQNLGFIDYWPSSSLGGT